jgi:hypothetical protein
VVAEFLLLLRCCEGVACGGHGDSRMPLYQRSLMKVLLVWEWFPKGGRKYMLLNTT